MKKVATKSSDQIHKMTYFELLHTFDIKAAMENARTEIVDRKKGTKACCYDLVSKDFQVLFQEGDGAYLVLLNEKVFQPIEVLESLIAQVAWTTGDRAKLYEYFSRFHFAEQIQADWEKNQSLQAPQSIQKAS